MKRGNIRGFKLDKCFLGVILTTSFWPRLRLNTQGTRERSKHQGVLGKRAAERHEQRMEASDVKHEDEGTDYRQPC